jgi:hypothetical protein
VGTGTDADAISDEGPASGSLALRLRQLDEAIQALSECPDSLATPPGETSLEPGQAVADEQAVDDEEAGNVEQAIEVEQAVDDDDFEMVDED